MFFRTELARLRICHNWYPILYYLISTANKAGYALFFFFVINDAWLDKLTSFGKKGITQRGLSYFMYYI